MPSSNKLVPELMLTRLYDTIMASLGHNKLNVNTLYIHVPQLHEVITEYDKNALSNDLTTNKAKHIMPNKQWHGCELYTVEPI